MVDRRTPIVIALACGSLAAVAVWGYLRDVDRRADQGLRPAKLFVVGHAIDEGTPAEQAITEGRIKVEELPARFRPPNALTNLDLIKGKVASTALMPGQVLAAEYFADAKGGSAFARQIPDGQVAISVHVDEVRGVANFVQPGDQVDILVPSTEGVRTLFQNVNVIAVGRGPLPAEGQAQPTNAGDGQMGLVTFAVPLDAAQKIAFAASTASGGGVYLALVPPDNTPVAASPLAAAGVFEGSPSPYA